MENNMENIQVKQIDISSTIMEILGKLRDAIEKFTDHLRQDIYGKIHYNRAVYIIPMVSGKPIFTLRAKGGEYTEFNYYNTLDIYDLDVKEEPIERRWIPEFSPSDFEYYEEIQKIYEDDSGIALLYLHHIRKIVEYSPLSYKDIVDDCAIYYIYIPEIFS